jgi:DtxR family Mn-dependent transcriptional regulator
MSWAEVHDEAELLEHAVSERLIDHIDQMLGRPAVDPHGDPIPTAEGTMARPNHIDLASAPVGEMVTVERVIDQDPDFLRFIEQRELMPGSRVRIRSRDMAADALEISSPEGHATTVGLRAAAKVMVSLGAA